ncbi:N-glycosidase YbiA-like isoform X2 [Dysidea avara]
MAVAEAKPVEKFHFFWKSKSPFSQWYSAQFKVDDVEYNCAEQYMMYQKAKLFKDDETAKLILESSSPKDQKALGRKVQNFVEETWTAHCRNIVKAGNRAKFSQNPDLKKVLFDTAGHTIVEASPVDKIWGIGLAQDDPRASDRNKWRGTNWLGQALTEVRDELLEAEK